MLGFGGRVCATDRLVRRSWATTPDTECPPLCLPMAPGGGKHLAVEDEGFAAAAGMAIGQQEDDRAGNLDWFCGATEGQVAGVEGLGFESFGVCLLAGVRGVQHRSPYSLWRSQVSRHLTLCPLQEQCRGSLSLFSLGGGVCERVRHGGSGDSGGDVEELGSAPLGHP